MICVQGQTQGQLDKLEESPNHWTFLTGTTVASLPVSRSASQHLCTSSTDSTGPSSLRPAVLGQLGCLVPCGRQRILICLTTMIARQLSPVPPSQHLPGRSQILIWAGS